MDSKVFLSYSRKDKSQVFALKDEINSYLGSGSCWIDLHGIESDQQFADVIINAINHTPIFLFLYSENSKDSVYAKKELEFATKKKKKIMESTVCNLLCVLFDCGIVIYDGSCYIGDLG